MFILHTPKSSKPTSIIIKKVLSDGPYKATIGVSILPAYWDKESERAKIDLSKAIADDHKSINALLKKIEDFIDARTRDARYTGNHLTREEMAGKLLELTGRNTEKKATGFYPKCRQIIADMESGSLLTPRGKKYSEGTVRCYNLTIDVLEDFNKALTWAAIDMKFYRAFMKWCNDEKSYCLNTIGQHIKCIKRLMKIGKSKIYQFHNCTGFMDEDFKYMQEQTDDIALSQKELSAIAGKNIPNKRWDIARDWFVIGCYLGLRVSDVKLLDKGVNFTSDSVVIANEKTDTKVVIPLNKPIRAIMKKWDGLPPKMADSEINLHIKKVCEIIGLDETFLYVVTKGGKRQDFYLKKYDMVSCHTMRRFFITELLRLQIPDNQVMQLAGIKKHATLLRYKKISAEENAMNMKGKAFFK